jgi:hypothetical protein
VPAVPKDYKSLLSAATSERRQIDILVDEIRKDPLADEPRQVLADALEQRGDPRGQLMQLQLRSASLASWDPAQLGLELQQRALLAQYGDSWRRELPKLTGVTWGSFSRGFVGTVAFASSDALIEHGATCIAATPAHHFALSWPYTNHQAELDSVATLRELTIHGTVMRAQDLEWLGSSPLMATVRALTLLDSGLSSLLALLKSPHLRSLRELLVPLHMLNDGNIHKLTQTAMPALTTLDLSAGTPEQEYSSGGRRYSVQRTLTSPRSSDLAGWRDLAHVRALDVSANKLGRSGLTALLKSPHTSALRALSIRGIADAKWDVDDSLAACGAGPAGVLDELDISDNDFDSEAADEMARCRALAELKVLRIERVESEHFARFVKAPWFDTLRVLACGDRALPRSSSARQGACTAYAWWRTARRAATSCESWLPLCCRASPYSTCPRRGPPTTSCASSPRVRRCPA